MVGRTLLKGSVCLVRRLRAAFSLSAGRVPQTTPTCVYWHSPTETRCVLLDMQSTPSCMVSTVAVARGERPQQTMRTGRASCELTVWTVEPVERSGVPDAHGQGDRERNDEEREAWYCAVVAAKATRTGRQGTRGDGAGYFG